MMDEKSEAELQREYQALLAEDPTPEVQQALKRLREEAGRRRIPLTVKRDGRRWEFE